MTILQHKTLLASIHDVSPHFDQQVSHLYDKITILTGSPNLALLVVPDYWGLAPLSEAKEFRTKLRSWSDAGAEIFLHGWHHKANALPLNSIDRFRGRHLTDGEGEFLALKYTESIKLMRGGRKLLEDIIGRPVSGFIAPAWLYGKGSREAMRDLGFAISEDHMRIWSPRNGETLSTGPVVTWASRSKMRSASSIAFAKIAPFILSRNRIARLAVHPGDLRKQSILNSVEECLSRFLISGRVAGRYADLVVPDMQVAA